MRNLTRLFLFLAPVAVGGFILFSLVAGREPPAQRPPEELSRSVRVITAQETDFVPRLRGYGVVSPARTWNAVAQVAGRVGYVHPDYKRGAILPQGAEIVRIAPEDYQIAIQQAEANIRSAEARLAELKSQEDNARQSLEIEKSSLALNQDDLERKKTLLSRGTIAQSAVDAEQRALLTQQARVQELENTLRLVPSQRNAQQQQIEVNNAQLESARLNLERTSVRLPFDARIAEASVEETQYVGVGASLGTADGIEAAEVNVQIPLGQFRSFSNLVAGGRVDTPPIISREGFREIIDRFGLKATILLRFDDFTLSWEGDVVRISDTVDPRTRTIGAIVEVDKPYERASPGERPPLVKGMFVEAELRANPLSGRIVIPRSAVHDGKIYIAGSDGRLEIRLVTTRIVQGDIAVIEEGLKAGERVVVSDLSPAIPNMLLDMVEDGELAGTLAEAAPAKEAGQ
ncbi:MAG: efflux RND transporter periplasmic adaptor subunit [Rhodomicrobiaceae bacterium]